MPWAASAGRANRVTPDVSEAFVRTNAALQALPLLPEIVLHLAHELLPVWKMTEAALATEGVPPPFWAFAWAGGQALARYLLDNPAAVAQREVVDVATGCGLVAIAAARAGARSVLAVDTDPVAVAAARINAIANRTGVGVELRDFRRLDPPGDSVVTVGDCFYERDLARSLLDWLTAARDRGSTVLIGDPGRTYLPRESLLRLADYRVAVSREIEDGDEKTGSVWRLAP